LTLASHNPARHDRYTIDVPEAAERIEALTQIILSRTVFVAHVFPPKI
jgi:hypothetical protein